MKLSIKFWIITLDQILNLKSIEKASIYNEEGLTNEEWAECGIKERTNGIVQLVNMLMKESEAHFQQCAC